MKLKNMCLLKLKKFLFWTKLMKQSVIKLNKVIKLKEKTKTNQKTKLIQ